MFHLALNDKVFFCRYIIYEKKYAFVSLSAGNLLSIAESLRKKKSFFMGKDLNAQTSAKPSADIIEEMSWSLSPVSRKTMHS